MDLRQLRYFSAVADRLSYSKAAKELQVSVSSLSRQVRQLEHEFDLRLFVRDRRHVELTDTGKIFWKEAKALVDQTASLVDRLRRAKMGEGGMVRIGVGLHLGETVSRVVAEHSSRYPAVDIEGTSMPSSLQNAALLQGRIDIGFLRGPVDMVCLNSQFLYEEKLLVLMSKANPLSRRNSLRVKDLASETLFLPDRNLSRGLHDLTLALFEKEGISPKVSSFPADPTFSEDIHKVVLAANKGIFIIPDEIATRARNGSAAVAVPLKDREARLDVRMAWRGDETRRAVIAVLDTARKTVGRRPLLETKPPRPV